MPDVDSMLGPQLDAPGPPPALFATGVSSSKSAACKDLETETRSQVRSTPSRSVAGGSGRTCSCHESVCRVCLYEHATGRAPIQLPGFGVCRLSSRWLATFPEQDLTRRSQCIRPESHDDAALVQSHIALRSTCHAARTPLFSVSHILDRPVVMAQRRTVWISLVNGLQKLTLPTLQPAHASTPPPIMQSDTSGPGPIPQRGDEGEPGPVDDWHGPVEVCTWLHAGFACRVEPSREMPLTTLAISPNTERMVSNSFFDKRTP